MPNIISIADSLECFLQKYSLYCSLQLYMNCWNNSNKIESVINMNSDQGLRELDTRYNNVINNDSKSTHVKGEVSLYLK
jgi:hypothetical protein